MPDFIDRPNFFIITGASGGGKSALISELRRRGRCCVDEAGREIVRKQLATGGDALPWAERAKFRDLLLARSIADFDGVGISSAPVFFDRGVPEAIAYSGLIGAPLDADRLRRATLRRYAGTVFVTPPWPEIFSPDRERRKAWSDVVEDFEVTIRTYRDLGYLLEDIPKVPAPARAEFVLARIDELEATRR